MTQATVINRTVQVSSSVLASDVQSGDIEVDCCLWGKLDKPLVVLMGGISANRWVIDCEEQTGWWNQVVHDKAVLNTRDFCFLTFEYICFDTEINEPATVVSTTDQAHVLYQIQQQLNLPLFHAVIGSSYGGMVSLAFAALYPEALTHLICIAAAHTNSVKSQALRYIQRQIMRLGSKHADQHAQTEFTALARSLAMVGYRGEVEWEHRFANPNTGQALDDVSAYLRHHGRQFAQRFEADRYNQLSKSIDYHQVDVSNIQAKTLLVGITSDQMVPVDLLQKLRDRMATDCQLHLINSIYGHDGFLLEADALNYIFKTFLCEQPHDNIERNNRRASGY